MLAAIVTTTFGPQSASVPRVVSFSPSVCSDLLMQEHDAEGEEEGLLKANLFLLSLCWVKRK